MWQGIPALSCVKTFGTKSCKLCTMERLEILKLTCNILVKAINKCREVHGACSHHPWFHRFDQSQIVTASTDESKKDEWIQGASSTTLPSSLLKMVAINIVRSFQDCCESPFFCSAYKHLTNFGENCLCRLIARQDFDMESIPQMVLILNLAPSDLDPTHQDPNKNPNLALGDEELPDTKSWLTQSLKKKTCTRLAIHLIANHCLMVVHCTLIKLVRHLSLMRRDPIKFL